LEWMEENIRLQLKSNCVVDLWIADWMLFLLVYAHLL
jgi:hypothetical protein